MTSDRSWVGRYRYDESKYLTEEYKNGVDSFLKFAIDHLKNEDEGLIRCPCQKCGNEYYKDPSDVRLDLYLHGIMQWYTRWDLHGEKEPQFETGTSSGNVGYNDDNICANPNELTSPNSGIVVIGTSYKESFGNYYGRLQEVGLSSFWFIVFLVLMAIGVGTSGERGDSSRGGRGNGKGGRGRGRGGNGSRGRGMGNGGGSGSGGGGRGSSGGNDDDGDDETSDEEGENDQEGQGESQNMPVIIYERAKRSCSEGDYKKPPAPGAPKAIVHFIDGKCIREPKKKKTLGYIIKVLWDENTHQSKGAEREAFYDLCLQKFKEYYDYQKGIDEAEGDRAVKEHMKVNWSNLPYLEKRRADRDASAKRKAGSRIGKNACDHQEHAHHSGAIPFSQRREDMESEKEGPVSNYDFVNTVYHFEKPADLKLKEDMERMMATESTPEDSAPTDPPLSPRSQKKLQLKKYFSLTLQVRPPRKGKTIMFPRHTVSEVLGSYEASQWTGSQSTQNSHAPSHHLSDDSLQFVLRVSADMNRLVHSLEMEEVPRSLLNERMHLLANEAFPNRDHDPEQQQSWFEYLRLAVSFVADAMVLYKKVILEVIVDALYSTPYVGS
ncbi:hypothetical protein POM88_003121 [Heracleum sosnowskyi]|uniref:Transposase-associated domain-containing protein n=1 Tax=Heracleum sosnowskyi TaxID=360622 RepID=A0AAD8NCN1_9APIA|nr:hypothetical protein POM88_003121 [Heracleum sosnowskyi]